ncbi:hypothetical protein C4552_01720 [Candidatus Parcubacteria bacterium]|nr:MAG: hypothetical protein C4552_01720 [Candidatus Parcubacteria bacterium]
MSAIPWTKIQSSVAILLIIVVVGGMIVVPPKKAEAVVPTNVDFSPKAIAEWILQTATAIKNLAENVLQTGFLNSLVVKEYALDPAAWLMKLVIQQLRDMAIQWILTGNFGGPTFSQGILIDLRNAVTEASKIFVSNLTGINFCDGYPPIPPNAFFSLDLSLRLQCSFTGGGALADFRNGTAFSWEMVASAQESANDPFNAYVDALSEKMRMEAEVLGAVTQEHLAGGGFYGIRGEDGKIKTPGRHIADFLQEDINSMFREFDNADELSEVFAGAITSIVDTFAWKIINDGLTAASN